MLSICSSIEFISLCMLVIASCFPSLFFTVSLDIMLLFITIAFNMDIETLFIIDGMLFIPLRLNKVRYEESPERLIISLLISSCVSNNSSFEYTLLLSHDADAVIDAALIILYTLDSVYKYFLNSESFTVFIWNTSCMNLSAEVLLPSVEASSIEDIFDSVMSIPSIVFICTAFLKLVSPKLYLILVSTTFPSFINGKFLNST